MIAVKFAEATGTLLPPEGEQGTVRDLAVYRNGERVISCWKASLLDRIRILFTGMVWLHIKGETHAPLYVGAEYPFERG